MNIRMVVFAFLVLFLVGCGSTAVPTPTPIPTVPTSIPPLEATSTAPVVTPTMGTPTSAVTEQTVTSDVTVTPQPTSTPTSGMQMTIVLDGQPTAAPTSGYCQHPQNWVVYTVQVSDTLSSLGQRTGTNWQQIQAANCLIGTVIFAGQTLYLPFVPPPVTPLPNLTPMVPTPPPPGPGDPKLTISPTDGQPGTTFIIGMDDFPRNQAITLEITFADTGESVLKVALSPNSDGDATLSYISPQDAQLGSYNVYADSFFDDSVVEKTGEFQISPP